MSTKEKLVAALGTGGVGEAWVSDYFTHAASILHVAANAMQLDDSGRATVLQEAQVSATLAVAEALKSIAADLRFMANHMKIDT